MWTIPDNQIVRIMNRISDIRQIPFERPVEIETATYELIGTLETILYDERNYKATIDPTTVILRPNTELNIEESVVDEDENVEKSEVSEVSE